MRNNIHSPDNRSFIAAANPTAIIELLEKFEHLTSELELTRSECNSMLADAQERESVPTKLSGKIERFSIYEDHGRANMMGDDDGEWVMYSHHVEAMGVRLAAAELAATHGATTEQSSAVAAQPVELSNAQIRAIMHNSSRMHQPGYYSDTEFDCLQDVITFARAIIAAARPAAALVQPGQRQAPEASIMPVELQGVCGQKDAGFWHSCSGCYDTEDGHPTGNYAHSAVFGCALGSGCHECGGLGVIWDNYDNSDADAAPAPAIQHAPSDDTEGGAV